MVRENSQEEEEEEEEFQCFDYNMLLYLKNY